MDENSKIGVSLRDFFESKLEAQEKAIVLASKLLEQRLESMNEFRSQLTQQANTFLTKTEHELFLQRIDAEIKALNKSKDMLEGKASANAVYVAYALSFIAILLGIGALLIK